MQSALLAAVLAMLPAAQPLPKITVSPDGRGFVTEAGAAFVPWGVNYYRPGTGWAPQVWKKFDADATRRDFQRLKELGGNCVRVFLTYGSFYQESGKLSQEGLDKFDQFLKLAEETGIYVHPTGPDHWEGLPAWAQVDRIADKDHLVALAVFWRLFAGRYAGRNVIFAYDLLNEPSVGWNSPAMRAQWNRWLQTKYRDAKSLATAWGVAESGLTQGHVAVPEAKDAAGSRQLLDYQLCREEVADLWTQVQAMSIKKADPKALVTVGLIQWSVPSLLPGVQHYAAFRPQRQAAYLDFLEVHFYPLAKGAYEYRSDEDEQRNLAYLDSVVREVAAAGKPVVLAEFGWYGGGKPTFDGGRHPTATEEQQARWCRRAVETTAGLATGWLNWGFHDHPEARDVSELIGLLTVDGKTKAWGREFQILGQRLAGKRVSVPDLKSRPKLDWDQCITSTAAGHEFREAYLQAFKAK